MTTQAAKNEPSWLTPDDVAKDMGLPGAETVVRNLIKKKDLPAMKIGNHWRIKREAYEAWGKLEIQKLNLSGTEASGQSTITILKPKSLPAVRPALVTGK